MATKTHRKKVTRSSSRRTQRSSSREPLLFSNHDSQWGKDQPMVLVMAAGIIIFIAVALFLTGWI